MVSKFLALLFMNKLFFVISFGLVGLIVATKILFFFQEPTFAASLQSLVELVILLSVTTYGCLSFFFKKNPAETAPTVTPPAFWPLNFTQKLLIIVIGSVIFFSSFINLTKKTLDWDDVALYDARANFMLAGMSLSEMSQLSELDFKNSYYYLLYPPFTSQVHYLWYFSNVPLPISLLYSFFLILLTTGIFALIQPRIGTTPALVMILLTITQPHIFNTTIVAYTNLPYSLYLTLGVLALHTYLTTKVTWQALFGILLVSLSQWIRFLEPTWLAITLAFGVAVLWQLPIKRAWPLLLLMAGLGFIEYRTWQFFVYTVARNQTIFETGLLNIFEPVVGVFTGTLVIILVFFCRAWGIPLLIHAAALVSSNKRNDHSQVGDGLFLKLVLLACFSMYFAGLYFISFQVPWWPEMGGSLVRSSTYMLPISLYLLVKEVKEYWPK
jgi:hypothetical protein